MDIEFYDEFEIDFETDLEYIEPEITSLEVNPQKETQTYSPPIGKYYSSVTVNGDNNLVPENIVKGITIFGVEGDSEGSTIPEQWYTLVEEDWRV